MQPFGNNILFRPFDADSISAGGIIVPDSCKTVSNRGEIVAVGEGTEQRPMKLTPGTVGYRVKDCGTEIQKDGVTYFLMEDKAIIALEK